MCSCTGNLCYSLRIRYHFTVTSNSRRNNCVKIIFMTKTCFCHHSLTYRSKSPSLFSSCCVVRPSVGSVAGVTSTSSLAFQPLTRTTALVLQVSWNGGQTSSYTHSKPCRKTWFCFHWRSRCNIQTALSKHHIQNERHLGSDTTQFGIQVPQWGRFLAFFNLWRMTVKVTGLVQHLLWLCLIYIFTKNGDEQYHRHIHLYCLNKSGMLEHKLAPTYLSTCTWHHTWKIHILTLNSIRTPDLKSQFCCHRTTP